MFIDKKYDNLQIRYFVDKKESLKEFQFNNGEFKIIGVSQFRDLINQNKSPFWNRTIFILKSTNYSLPY